MNNWDITKTIGYTVMNMGRQMSRHVNQHIAMLNDDVTMQQGAVLYFISRNTDCDMIQQDIAVLMDINKSATLRTIDILEKKGYVRRSPVDNDRRKNRVEVTKEGQAVVSTFIKAVKEKDETMKKDLTDAEVKGFFKVMNILHNKICSG